MAEVKKEKFTVTQFHKEYPDDDACLHQIFLNQYGSATECPDCGKAFKYYKVTGRKVYACQSCGHQISPLANTIFHKSSTSLKNWFFAIFLFSASKNGVAAKELERQLGVTYKCAWRMGHQIRKLFEENPGSPLSGVVEIDETMIGGKRKGKRGRGAEGKTVVFGMVERKGRIKTQVVDDVKRKTLQPIIESNVEKGSTVCTDELKTYNNLNKLGYDHDSVNHGRKQYAKGSTHTNTAEGYWSQLKRSIDGTHHHVSKKHLDKYADEFEFRYNHREDTSPIFRTVVSRVQKLA